MAVAANIITLLILGVVGLGLFAGAIVLQIYLSKKEGRWPGLVLPVLSFILSLWPLLFFLFSVAEGPWGIFTGLVLPILLGNIPTVVYLAIYFANRGRDREKKRLDRMNIQDL